jgi:hypothetical protein
MAVPGESPRQLAAGELGRPAASDNGPAAAAAGLNGVTETPASPLTSTLDGLRDAAAAHDDDLVWPGLT